MKEKNNYIAKAYEPYHKETQCSLLRDVLLILIIILITLFLFPIIVLCELPLIVFELWLSCRISIMSIIEQKKGLYEKKVVRMICVKNEETWLWKFENSKIPSLYPKSKDYGRYLIICQAENSTRLRLRCAVSGNNHMILINNINKEGGWIRTVTYGKLSKIIVSYNDKDDDAYILTHHLNKKEKHIKGAWKK